MYQIYYDSFTGPNDTVLSSHTSDTGHTYSTAGGHFLSGGGAVNSSGAAVIACVDGLTIPTEPYMEAVFNRGTNSYARLTIGSYGDDPTGAAISGVPMVGVQINFQSGTTTIRTMTSYGGGFTNVASFPGAPQNGSVLRIHGSSIFFNETEYPGAISLIPGDTVFFSCHSFYPGYNTIGSFELGSLAPPPPPPPFWTNLKLATEVQP